MSKPYICFLADVNEASMDINNSYLNASGNNSSKGLHVNLIHRV